MKSFFLFTTALLSSSVLAQSTSQAGGQGGASGGGLPECAKQCALKAIQDSKCGSEDPSCVCKAPGFAESYVSCVGSSCGPREAAAAISAGIRLCEAAGVTITAVPSATAGSESKSKAHGPTSAAPVVPAPPVVPTAPPVVTSTAPAPIAATPVPTAGANSLNTGVAAIGMVWASMMFLFALM